MSPFPVANNSSSRLFYMFLPSQIDLLLFMKVQSEVNPVFKYEGMIEGILSKMFSSVSSSRPNYILIMITCGTHLLIQFFFLPASNLVYLLTHWLHKPCSSLSMFWHNTAYISKISLYYQILYSVKMIQEWGVGAWWQNHTAVVSGQQRLYF